MSVVEKKLQLFGGVPESKKNAETRTTSSDTPIIGEDAVKKASKVSQLREMFQSGSFCPVEELDNRDVSLTNEQFRLMRTCRGSPPLLSLRDHGSEAPSSTTVKNRRLSNDIIPPARPPKPKGHLLKSDSTLKHDSPKALELHPSIRSRVSPRLLQFVAVFESGSLQVDGSAKPKTPGSIPKKADKGLISNSDSSTSSKLAMTIPQSAQTAPTPLAPVTSSASKAVSKVNERLNSSAKPNRIDNSAKKRGDPSLHVSSEVSFSPLAPGSADSSAIGDGDLQHAEPIAVATPDEDEEEATQNEMERLGLTAVQQLEVPPGLKVVAVDPLGVHILEDGNFFYAVPGVADRPDSLAESSFLTSHSPKSKLDEQCVPGSTVHDSDLSLTKSTHDDSTDKRVRFSTEPILIFSTHSTTEYDRKNDEIDPIAASAAYELEKRLESMELIDVDLKKSDQGLGLSIVGVGLDLDGGEKLGIFIKALSPGGAAETSGKVKPNDQIVEVNGINLVGVSYEFAAQTLRSTGEVVHFVLGRTTDPANLWMLAEQEEDGPDEPADDPVAIRSCD